MTVPPQPTPSSPLSEQPLTLGDPALFAGLRAALLRAGYTSVNVDKLLYAENASPGTPLEIAVALRRVRGDTPLHTLTRLFRLRAAVPVAAAQAAFSPADVRALAATGLLAVTGDEVTSPFDLR